MKKAIERDKEVTKIAKIKKRYRFSIAAGEARKGEKKGTIKKNIRRQKDTTKTRDSPPGPPRG